MRASRLLKASSRTCSIARPNVHDLYERLVVQRALFERDVLQSIVLIDDPVDVRCEFGQRFGLSTFGKTDEAVVLKSADRGVVERVDGVDLISGDRGHGRSQFMRCEEFSLLPERSEFAGLVLSHKLHVSPAEPAHVLNFFLVDRANDPTGYSHYQHSIGDFHPGRDNCTGGNQAFLADNGVSQQHGANADQRASTNALAMHDCPVPDRNIMFDRVRIAGVTMYDAAILDVDPLTDHYGRDIAANYSREPHAALGAELHIAGDGRTMGQIGAGRSFTKPFHT